MHQSWGMWEHNTPHPPRHTHTLLSSPGGAAWDSQARLAPALCRVPAQVIAVPCTTARTTSKGNMKGPCSVPGRNCARCLPHPSAGLPRARAGDWCRSLARPHLCGGTGRGYKLAATSPFLPPPNWMQIPCAQAPGPRIQKLSSSSHLHPQAFKLAQARAGTQASRRLGTVMGPKAEPGAAIPCPGQAWCPGGHRLRWVSLLRSWRAEK